MKKKYDQKLFVGNIMQRTMFEDHVIGPMTVSSYTNCWVIKRNALLYKTKNGGYVDIDVLNLDGLFAPLKTKIVDKVEIETCSKETSNGLTVMPAVSLSDVSNPTKEYESGGVLGLFVDADSLVPYIEFRNNQTKDVGAGRSK